MRAFSRFNAVALGLCFTLALATPPTLAQTGAQSWPQRTVRLIVPLPPGSGTDIAGRLLAERLAQRWGQPVVVENRQGGDGIPAVTTFLGARDTHQLLLSFAGIITINPMVHERLPYDPVRDLVPIVPVVDNFFGVSATSGLKAESLADLVRIAKAQPGKLNWAATPGLPYYVHAGAAEECRNRHGAGALSRLRAGRSGFDPGTAARRSHGAAVSRAASSRRHGQAPVRDQSRAFAAGARSADSHARRAIPISPSKAPSASTDGVICRQTSRNGFPQTCGRSTADPAFRAKLAAAGTAARIGTVGGIRRSDRGAARQDRGDPSGQREVRKVER